MPQIFKPKDNEVFRAVIIGGVIFLIVLIMALDLLQQSSYFTKTATDVEQPVPFSHEHHVGGLGIDCRFCHTSVEQSSFAGMPSTEICMKCHREIWKDSPVLEPVRQSFRTGSPILWNRVHNLPDYVYFDHSIHVQKGVSCLACHGRVDRMPLMHKQNTLYMRWCLDCHQHPGNFVSASARKEFQNPYLVKQITNCSACHR